MSPKSTKKVEVLIVDDSAFMRKVLKDLLESDPDINIVDCAKNGQEAVDKVKEFHPDVITMDINMPIKDGISATKEIMAEMPTPVVIISLMTNEESRKAIEALSAGAVDIIVKPSGSLIPDVDSLSGEILTKVKVASLSNLKEFTHLENIQGHFDEDQNKIIVIGASTGGPGSIEVLLSAIPKDFPIPILIVQHMPPNFTKSFAGRLDSICALHVKEAVDDEIVYPGNVYIAPGDYHMEIGKTLSGKIKILLDEGERIHGVRPCVDRLFDSAAKIFGQNSIGVILTGMGHDGTEGARTIKKHDGVIIVESKESSIIYGMPGSVVNSNCYDLILDLRQIAQELVKIAGS